MPGTLVEINTLSRGHFLYSTPTECLHKQKLNNCADTILIIGVFTEPHCSQTSQARSCFYLLLYKNSYSEFNLVSDLASATVS
jgi:hypothetical protein